ncbi:MAG: MBL fold metallo-hydrolase [bacterium]|nr:MBL fold metallo-hydrolase [bacterium]
MHLSWYGQSCFKIQTKNATIVVDPFDRAATGLEPPRSKADVVVFTHKHADHTSGEYKNAEFTISGPGEYEVRGVHFYGFPVSHDDVGGKRLGFTAAFLIEADDLRILHLGDLGAKNLSSEQIEELGDVDIMLVPIGGTYTLDAEDAEKLVRNIEPHVVIPMHYALPRLKIKLDGVDKFLREMGAAKKEALPKYMVKKKDLPPEGTEVVVLELATGE